MAETVTTPLSSPWGDLLNGNRGPFLQAVAQTPWRQVLELFETSSSGLDSKEAAARRKRCGQNVTRITTTWPWWKALLFCLANLHVVLLLGVHVNFAALILVICSILLIMVFSSVEAWRTRHATSRLLQALHKGISVDVLRPISTTSGQPTIVRTDIVHLVPGDLIYLRTGDFVPADCLLMPDSQLSVSTSGLNGRDDVLTRTDKPDRSKTTALEASNIVLTGMHITSGTGLGVVVGTGRQTYLAHELGAHEGIIHKKREEQNKKFIISILISFVSVVFYFFYKWILDYIQYAKWWDLGTDYGTYLSMFFVSAAAMSLVPVMLPTVFETIVTVGARKLTKLGIAVKHLRVLRDLCRMKILCVNKAGVLTEDSIVLQRVEDGKWQESSDVLRLAYTEAMSDTANEKRFAVNHAIEKAGQSANIAAVGEVVTREITAGIIGEFNERLSGVVVRTQDGRYLMILRGPVQDLVDLRCEDDVQREHFVHRARQHNENGYNVLGIATKTFTELPENWRKASQTGFILQGLLTFSDTPRLAVSTTVAALQNLGIEIKVFSNDDDATASKKLCRDLGIGPDNLEDGIQCLTLQYPSSDLTNFTPVTSFTPDQREALKKTTVFSIQNMENKAALVKSLRPRRFESRHNPATVGVLGDSYSDHLALREADISMAAHNGALIAKDSADMILSRKSLSDILEAVRVARSVRFNMVRYAKILQASILGDFLALCVASRWLPYPPMDGEQLLLKYFLWGIVQLAMPWDRVDEEDLQAPAPWTSVWSLPWDVALFALFTGPILTVMNVLTVCANWFHFGVQANNSEVPLAQTHLFILSISLQMWWIEMLKIKIRKPKLSSFFKVPRPFFWVSNAVVILAWVIPLIPVVGSYVGMKKPVYQVALYYLGEVVACTILVLLVRFCYTRVFKKWL